MASVSSTNPSAPYKFDTAIMDWLNMSKTVSAFDKIDVLSLCAEGMRAKEVVFAPAAVSSHASSSSTSASPAAAGASRVGGVASLSRRGAAAPSPSPSSPSAAPALTAEQKHKAFLAAKAAIETRVAEAEREAQEAYEREVREKSHSAHATPTATTATNNNDNNNAADPAKTTDTKAATIQFSDAIAAASGRFSDDEDEPDSTKHDGKGMVSNDNGKAAGEDGNESDEGETAFEKEAAESKACHFTDTFASIANFEEEKKKEEDDDDDEEDTEFKRLATAPRDSVA